jgi:hypothetical protein
VTQNRWTFRPPSALQELIAGWEEKVVDWSPVMQVIAGDMEKFVEETIVPSQGEGKWAPMAASTVKRHGPHSLLVLSGALVRQTGRDWSKRNAVVINDSPHAHLMRGGVKWYPTARYYEAVVVDGKKKKHRRSAGQIREHEKMHAGSMHSPVRDFVYVTEERVDELYGPMILDYWFGEIER